jgi:A/G-specific adenine glycosylase
MVDQCVAFSEKRISELPVKSKKIVKTTRFFHYLILNHQGQVYIQKRAGKDIWQDLYQFPLLETASLEMEWPDLHQIIQQNWNGLKLSAPRAGTQVFQQILTHQVVNVRFWELELSAIESDLPNNWVQIRREELGLYAFPRVIDRYLKDDTLYLNLV